MTFDVEPLMIAATIGIGVIAGIAWVGAKIYEWFKKK